MIKMIITTAGRQALINATSTGTNKVTVEKIAVGGGQYTPSESQTGLQKETKRLAIVEGGSAGDNSIHVAYRDDSTDSYSVYEFGIYLTDGTLFAVYSSSQMLIQKTNNSVAFLAVDIAFDDINVEQISFGELTYSNAAATTENAGVIALATDEEVAEGTATQKAVTPKSLHTLKATDTQAGLVEIATEAETKEGTTTDKAVTPATLKSMHYGQLATAEETIAGTSAEKSVTPAGLASVTATEARKGLVELATEAETKTGTDGEKAVTPAGLNAVIKDKTSQATTEKAGVVELATTAEIESGDETRAATPAGVQHAIATYSAPLNKHLAVAEGGSKARTLASHFGDILNPKDFGAITDGATDSTFAFNALEAAVTGRDINLNGETYIVKTRPQGNNYYNGFFKINGELVKPVYDFYKFGGTAPRGLNVKRDFTDASRGGGALLAADYIRQGTSAGAVIQSCVWDDANRYLYTLHTTSEDKGVINRFATTKLGGGNENSATAYTEPSAYVGHQGLGIQYMGSGAVKLWASMAYETAGASVYSKGTKAVRFSVPTSNAQNIDSTVEVFNLFPEVEGSNQATTVCTSYSGAYLIAKYSVNGTNDYRVRIFKLSDLTKAGDYSNKYIHEFTITLTRDVDDVGGVAKALQGMACDDRYIYFLASSYGYAERHSIYVSDMFGNVVDEYRDLSLGKEIGVQVGTTYYEPQSLFFMSFNGQPKLVMQIATGDVSGRRLCHLIALNARQSYFFPTGTGYGNFHALAIDEQSRVVNAEGKNNMSLYPSGLSQDLVARAGTCQRAQMRFTDDTAGNSYVMFKSRGTKVGESLSAIAGDVIGQFTFLVDNGNIDYDASVQGARAAWIEGGVFESSSLSSAGTTNVGVRGYLRLYACSDANSRNGVGLEIIDNAVRPTVDNAQNLGTAGRRWKSIYAMTDVIATSDEREKVDISSLDASYEMLDSLGKLFRKFKLKSDVEELGDDAKYCFGVVAQEIENLLKGHEPYENSNIVSKHTDENGNEVYGIRYRDLFTVILNSLVHFAMKNLWPKINELYTAWLEGDIANTIEGNAFYGLQQFVNGLQCVMPDKVHEQTVPNIQWLIENTALAPFLPIGDEANKIQWASNRLVVLGQVYSPFNNMFAAYYSTRSPDGTMWHIKVDDNGNLYTEKSNN